MLLEEWSERLRERVFDRFEELTDGSGAAPPLPEGFRRAILDALEQQDMDTALLSCAAEMHCGGEGERGLVPAVSVVMLEAALASHMPVLGLGGGNSVFLDHGEATALLVGDALIPLAFQNISSSGSVERHAVLVMADAVHAVSARGALERLGLEVERDDRKIGERITEGSGDIPLVPRESLGRFAAVAGARMAGAPESMVEEMAKFGLELGRASGLPALSGRMCRLFGISRSDLGAEALALLHSAAARLGDTPEDALARRLLSKIESSLSEPDLLSGAG